MHRTSWSTWKKFLSNWGLLSPTCTLLKLNHSLIPVAAQVLYLGMPLFKSAAMGDSFEDLLDLLVDEDALRQFANYLLIAPSEQELGA